MRRQLRWIVAGGLLAISAAAGAQTTNPNNNPTGIPPTPVCPPGELNCAGSGQPQPNNLNSPNGIQTTPNTLPGMQNPEPGTTPPGNTTQPGTTLPGQIPPSGTPTH